MIVVGFKGCIDYEFNPNPVLAFDIQETEPDDLRPQVSVSADGTLEIQSMLWNPGDSTSIRVLLDHCFDRDGVDVSTRIRGMKGIEYSRAPKDSPVILFLGLALYAGGLFAFFFGSVTLGIGWLLVSLVIIAEGLRRRIRYRENRRRLHLRAH